MRPVNCPVQSLRDLLDREMRALHTPTYTTRGGCENKKTKKALEITGSRVDLLCEALDRLNPSYGTTSKHWMESYQRVIDPATRRPKREP